MPIDHEQQKCAKLAAAAGTGDVTILVLEDTDFVGSAPELVQAALVEAAQS